MNSRELKELLEIQGENNKLISYLVDSRGKDRQEDKLNIEMLKINIETMKSILKTK